MSKTVLVNIIILLFFAGCVRPLNLWLADSDVKQEMLTKTIREYHQSLHWGDVSGVLKYVEPSKRQKIAAKIPKDGRAVQYVDCDVLNTDEDSETGYMKVQVKIKSYTIPSYKVTEQIITEQWEFQRFGGGWMLKSSDLFPELQTGSNG